MEAYGGAEPSVGAPASVRSQQYIVVALQPSSVNWLSELGGKTRLNQKLNKKMAASMAEHERQISGEVIADRTYGTGRTEGELPSRFVLTRSEIQRGGV
jgi:hypothetical protein